MALEPAVEAVTLSGGVSGEGGTKLFRDAIPSGGYWTGGLETGGQTRAAGKGVLGNCKTFSLAVEAAV